MQAQMIAGTRNMKVSCVTQRLLRGLRDNTTAQATTEEELADCVEEHKGYAMAPSVYYEASKGNPIIPATTGEEAKHKRLHKLRSNSPHIHRMKHFIYGMTLY